MMRGGFALGSLLALSCLVGVGVGPSNPANAGLSAAAAQPAGSTSWQLAQVKSGDTVEAILMAAGASPTDAALVAKALRTAFNPRDLKPGQQFALSFDSSPSGVRSIRAVSLEIASNRFVHVTRHEAGGYAARQAAQPLVLRSVGQALPALTLPSTSQARPVLPVESVALPTADTTPALASKVVAAPEAASKATSTVKGQTVEIKKGDTLASLLRAARINSGDSGRALEALRAQINVGTLSIGQKIIIGRGARTKNGHELAGLAVAQKDGGFTEVVRRADGNYGTPDSVIGDAPQPKVAPAAEPKADIAAAAPMASDVVAATASKKTARPDLGKAREEIVTLLKGGTLHSLLKKRGYSPDDIASVARATALSIDPTSLRWGQRIRLAFHAKTNGQKRLDALVIERKDQPPLLITRLADGGFGPRSAAGEGAAPIVPVIASAGSGRAGALDESGSAGDSAALIDSAALFVEEQAAPRDAAYRVLVEPGDSLMNMLLREGVDGAEIDLAVRSLRKIYNPRRLRESQTVALLTDTDSTGGLHLAALSIEVSDQRYVEARRGADGNFASGFGREPSFADRLPPEGADVQLYANYPALPQVGLAQAALNMKPRNQAAEDRDEPEGWSVLSWLGGVGDLIGHTSSAEAAVIDLAPEPPPNRALDLSETTEPAKEDIKIRKVEIAKGDTLVSALTKSGISAPEGEAIVAAFKKVHSPRRLQVGQTMTLAYDAVQLPSDDNKESEAPASKTDPILRRVSLSVGPDRDIIVERGGDDRFTAREVERPLVRTVYKATGRISSSFYVSAMRAGLSLDVVTQMVQLFSYDVDFQRGLQAGDRFEVLFERIENDRGEIVEQGTLLYASLTLSGEELAFYRYEEPNGPADYFDRAGNNVRKALLRTPIDGARISSGFGVRKHPILGYSKKHKGVDFSAPPGTPIYAAGDGVIEKIGAFSSYGKYVRIRHNDTFKTAYAHMKDYARGLKVGTRVRQGRVIGYVGSTGRSTGPHLHYEVMKEDVQVNPNGTKLPTGSKLGGKQFARFKTEIEGYKMMFAQAGTLGTRVARNTGGGN